MATFEQTVAAKSVESSPDPIYWSQDDAFRSCPYRQLHHQKGVIGTFSVRLLEAKNLERRHWSLLSLGPVKHLGLSKAHGEVSAFAEFQLGFMMDPPSSVGSTVKPTAIVSSMGQPSVRSTTPIKTASLNSGNDNGSAFLKDSEWLNQYNSIVFPSSKRCFKSTTVPSNSNPTWSSVQSSTNTSLFSIPLLKGSMPVDGMSILLHIAMREERTAADSFIPGMGGITKGGAQDGQLGVGFIDLTNILLRREHSINYNSTTTDGATYSHQSISADVWDVWVDLFHDQTRESRDYATASSVSNNHRTPPKSMDSSKPSSFLPAGQVRLLISYEPNGLIPRIGDVVAFETFARVRDQTMTSIPIVPPLHPLRVIDVRGEYVLVRFDLGLDHGSKTLQRTGTVRLHRNCIFVIERTNILDAAVNTALTPIDFALSTPLGQGISHHAYPYVEAAGELLMPAILSARLLFEAFKVGGSATMIGVKTAAAAILKSQDPEKRRTVQKSMNMN